LLGVTVVLSVVGAIGLASAVTTDRHVRPAAAKAPAAVEAPVAVKAAVAVKAPAAVRAPDAVKVQAADKAQAPPGAVRSRGHLLGLVAPLSAQQRGAAVRDRATRSESAARPLARRVMVGRSRQAKVMVSALADPKVTVGSQPTGVAVSTTRAYVASQGSNSVSVIDLTQNPPVVVATIPVGSQPDAAVLSADGARVYAANFGSGSVSVIETVTNAVAKMVVVGSRPTGIVEVGGLVYVANLSSHSVSVFDPALPAPTATEFTVPATGASLSAPSGLAASANGQRLYVNDARNGRTFVFDLTQNPPVSTGSVLNGDGTYPAYLSVTGTTGYSANPGTNSIRVLDLTALTATNVPVGSSPYGVLALPSLGQVFAANSGSDDLTVIDTGGAPTALTPTVATGDVPDAIAAGPDQQTVVVSNEGEGTVSIFHVNQPPQNTVPGAQSMGYNPGAAVHNTLVFSAAAARQITFSDLDAAASASPLKVTLVVAHGTLTLAQTTGLVFVSGGNGQASMTFTGLQADVTAALNGLAYEPASAFIGADSLGVTVEDQGNTGLGKPQVSSSSVAISVVDTGPTDIALSLASVSENQPVATTVGSFSSSDPDAGEVFAYSLVAGAGSTDNGSFQIVGGALQTNAIFNFEAKSSYSIRVRSTDAGGQFFEKQLTVTINNVNEAPTEIALSPSSLNENLPVGTAIGTLTATDPDTGQTQAFTLQSTGCGGGPFPDNASFAVAGSSLNSAVSFNFEVKASYTICVRATDSGSPALSFDKQLTVTIVNVNEAPVNTVPAGPSVNEDTALNFTGANAVSVADPDAGGGAIQVQLSVTNGTLTMTTLAGLVFTVGDGTADTAMTFTGTLAAVNTALGTLRYDPTLNFPGAAASGTAVFSITTNDQGNTGSGGPLSDTDGFSVTVNQVNDAPVGGGDSAQTVGNVQLFYDLAPGAGVVGTTKTTVSTNGLLDNDSDPVEGSAVSVAGVVGCADVVTPFDCSTANGGSLTVNANGRFSFRPAAGNTAADSFEYVLTDSGTPVAQNVNVTVNLSFVGNRIWFVKNNQGAGGVGRSNDPFDTLVEAQTAATLANDRVFVYAGDGTTTGQNAGFVFANNSQTLQGEAVALTTGTTVNGINNATLVAAGSQPLIGNAAGIGVTFTNRTGTTVTGLSIAGSTKAVEMTTSAAATGTYTITNNTIRGAGAEGIDVNLNAGTTGTVTLAITNNNWNTAGTHTGNAIDVNRAAGTLNLNLSGNTNVLSTGGSGIVVAGGAVASTTITGFAGNSVHGNTAGAGITISNVTFDSNLGVAGIQQVDGDNLPVGASGNPVGGPGLALTSSQGNLFFDDLDVYAASGTALAASGTGSGLTLTVSPATPDGVGTSTIDADNDAALDISTATIDLRLALLESTTAAAGVNLAGVGGQFRAPVGSSITKTAGAGTAFSVANSVSGTTVTYAGTLNVTSGAGVSLSSNTGSTISFSGGVTLSTGTNAAFNATGGGTVTVTGASNTLSTTTGTALNVANTTIGATGLTFLSISAGTAATGPANGILLNTTGSSGGLTVTGTATTDGTGGTIQNTTTRGVSIISASSITLKNMNLTNAATVDFPAAPTGLSLGNNTADNASIHLQASNGVTLDNLNITGSAEQGINAHNVNNLTLTNSVLSGLGNAADEDGIHAYNLSGTTTIISTSITSSGDDNVNIQNNTVVTSPFSHTGTINVTGGSFNAGVLGSGLLFGIRGTWNTTLNISGVTINNNFSGGVVSDTFDTATSDVEVTGSTITNNNDAIAISSNNGNTDFDVHDNANLSGQDFVNISVLKAAFSTTGSLEGRIRNNTITTENGHTADGISVFNAGGGPLNLVISTNTFNYAGTQRAINIQGGQDGASTLNATVTGNTIAIQLDGIGNAVNGVLANSQVADPSGAGSSLCADLGGAGALSNTFTHPLGGTLAGGDMRVRQRFAANVRLPGYGGGATDTTAVAAYLDGRNAEVSPSTATFQSGTFSGGAACTQPTP
jgi:YVTN family beta-propeller protein